MINVGNSTMTITTLIHTELLATGIVAGILVHEQETQNNILLSNCCQLGYSHFTFVIFNYCKDDHLEAEAYCDTSNGGGGWLVVQRGQDGSVDFNSTWIEYELKMDLES